MTTSTIDRTAWKRTTDQQRALRALTDEISQNPSALQDAVRRARADEFGSLDDLLLAAHAQWVRTFDARLDALAEHGGYGDQPAVDALWRETASALNGLALLLSHYADNPAIIQMHAQHARRIQRTMAVALPSQWMPPRSTRAPKRATARRGWACRAKALIAH